MGSVHVAVVAFPFDSHAAKLLMVARALATAEPSATFSFISTAASLSRLPTAAAPANLRFVEAPSGGADDEVPGIPQWRRMELFAEAAEAGGLRQALETACAAAGGTPVSCVVGDAFMSMAADAGVPWVAVRTGGPCALLAHVSADAIRKEFGDHAPGRADEPLTSHPGLGMYRVRDLPFGSIMYRGGVTDTGGSNMFRVMTTLLRRVPRSAAAVALNAFPGLLPEDVSAALSDALPSPLPIGPLHLLPGAAAADDDPHGCLAWLARRRAGTVAYVSFGTAAALPPDELRELAAGLEASGAPFLWSLREAAWPLLPPGFLDDDSTRLVVPWAPQRAVLRHQAVGAFVTHSGWGSVVEAMSGGVPMACRPFFGDQMMNARAVARLWCFGTALGDDETPMTRDGVAEVVVSLLKGEEGTRMRARARELQTRTLQAFGPDGGSVNNFRKFVDIVCAAVRA